MDKQPHRVAALPKSALANPIPAGFARVAAWNAGVTIALDKQRPPMIRSPTLVQGAGTPVGCARMAQ